MTGNSCQVRLEIIMDK